MERLWRLLHNTGIARQLTEACGWVMERSSASAALKHRTPLERCLRGTVRHEEGDAMFRIERTPPPAVFLAAVLSCAWGIYLPAESVVMAATTPQQFVVTDSDSGKQISLAVGDGLTVRLAAQPGTGYGWQIEPDSTKLLALESNTSAGLAAVPGGQDIQILTFRAGRPGTGRLRLGYRRPWQKSVPATKQFMLIVSIADR